MEEDVPPIVDKPKKMTTAAAPALDRNADLELVERHRYGDSEAFEEVVERFQPMIYNLALRMTGNAADAADLSQEVFLRLLRHLGSFRGGSSLKTWVFRVALNACRSRLRRRWRRNRIVRWETEEAAENLPDPRRGPEGETLRHDLEEQLAAALASLPEKFRAAVILRDLEGLRYDEIAAVTGARIGTVRSRIARGRERLRKIWEARE